MSPDTEASTANRTATDEAVTPLQWPPPGLERLHGALWPVNTLFGVGGALMALPMLWTLSSRQPFWSPGPLGGAWWVPGVISLAGLFLVVAGLVRASQLGVLAARGAGNGYDARTVVDVACDATRDAGFLLQGLRQYGSLAERERRQLLDARILAAFASGAALLWIPVAFTAGIVLAARGVVHGVAPLWPLILSPTAVLLCVGLCARGFDEAVTRRARRAWCRSGTGNGNARLEAAEWMRERAARTGLGNRAASPRPPRLSAFGFGALALALPLPVILLAVLSTVGPIITRIAAPRMTTMAARITRMEILRPYALPPDPSISPTDAGESLQVLSFVGGRFTPRAPVERPPVQAITEPWIPRDAPPSLHDPRLLAQRVYERHEPLRAEEQEWLERMGSHPGHAEIARLARAASADIVATRWNTDQFASTNFWQLPISRFGGLREGSDMHIALGLLAARRGDAATAETRFREVISAGLLLARSGTSLIDMLIGGLVAQNGANALRLFYESTGRQADADGLRLALEAVDRAESSAKSLQPGVTPDLQGLARIAANADLPPGIRWESLMHTRINAGCLTARSALFGHPDGYDEWLENVNGSLVRFPSEEALFDLVDSGPLLPANPGRRMRLVRALYALTFGENGTAGTCAGIATGLAMGY